MLASAVRGSERSLVPGVKRGFGGGDDGGERAVPVVDAYFIPWFDGDGPEAIRFFGQDVEGVWRLNK